ncbi:alkaline phosphatase family protein [Haloarchaeobius sp. DFWS5]|uniref:alkaline phosphatase family protein n=1 Tax=Haloarchaeobius sp. DFWS5 TaxID=3446114 RepID=UPI003EC0501C
MFRTSIETVLNERLLEDGYLFPDYDGYCFASVPHTVASLLGVETGRTLPTDVFDGVDTAVENVLVFLVDGFGWNQWKREREHHVFLDELSETARVTPLTSIYPSETAAAITTFHTGALPAEHGIVGWDVWDPLGAKPFVALEFQPKTGTDPDGLTEDDVCNAEPIYPTLAEAGVESHHVLPFPGTYDGATTHRYESLDEFPGTVEAALTAADGPSYTFCYLPHVDHQAHYTGTRSTEYRKTIDDVFDAIERSLGEVDDTVAEETLVLVTADHGHVNTDPDLNVNLDQYDELVDALQTDATGEPVRLSGSPRNVNLHLEPDRIGDVRELLLDELDAKVFTQEAVLDRELFGDVEPSDPFLRRVGDLVLTHRYLMAWWGDTDPKDLELVGMHGGLHPDEMLTQVAAVRLSELTE